MCGTQPNIIEKSVVSNDETYTRWVYIPRYGESLSNLNPVFISLRPGEEGISGQILERTSHEVVLHWGMKFRRQRNDGKPNEEQFVGYAKALVGNMRNVAEANDKIDVILTESEVPAHAEIRFCLNGESVRGNTQNPIFLRYKDKLKDLLSKNICTVTKEVSAPK